MTPSISVGSNSPYKRVADGGCLARPRYVPAFRDHEIDWEVLARLTSEEAGREVLLRLLEDADVLVENFKPGSMERPAGEAAAEPGARTRPEAKSHRATHLRPAQGI